MESSEPFERKKTDESVIGNFSVLDTAGDLTPAPDGLSPYNRYEDKEGNAFYALFQNPKMQFVVSELASLAVPIAPILLRKKMPEGNYMDFSAGVEQHPDFAENKDVFKVGQEFLYRIFHDFDHQKDWNHKDGVHYDFGSAKLNQDSVLFEDTYNSFSKENPSLVSGLKRKIEEFKKHIDGVDGLEFIKAVVMKADYKDIEPEKIQQVLLGRCKQALQGL